MVDRASNSEKRVAKSEEYQSVHELHESAVHSTPAHLLGSRKIKQVFDKNKHTQLSILNQDRTDVSQGERVFSIYGDDFLDEDFPSLSDLINQPITQEESFQPLGNELVTNKANYDRVSLSSIQTNKPYVAP